jgi:hypothetical protein
MRCSSVPPLHNLTQLAASFFLVLLLLLPKLLLPHHQQQHAAFRAPSFVLSPFQSFLLLSSSPAPPPTASVLLLHSTAHYIAGSCLLHSVAHSTTLHARVRVRSGLRKHQHQRRARNDGTSSRVPMQQITGTTRHFSDLDGVSTPKMFSHVLIATPITSAWKNCFALMTRALKKPQRAF